MGLLISDSTAEHARHAANSIPGFSAACAGTSWTRLIGPALLSVSSAANWGDLQTGESGDCLFVSGLCVAERESAVDRK